MSSLFSPFAASGNTSYFSRSCNQRGLYLSKNQSCKSETEKLSYVVSCFSPFSIVYFYMFSRVSSKRGFECRGQTSSGDLWKTVSVLSSPTGFCIHTSSSAFRECLLGRFTLNFHPFFFLLAAPLLRMPYTQLLHAKPTWDDAALLTCELTPLIDFIILL